MKKIIVVTGASSGMGVCFARQLAKESAGFKLSPKKNQLQLWADEIWLVARRADRLEETAECIRQDEKAFGLEHGIDSTGLFPTPVVKAFDAGGKTGALTFKNMLEQSQGDGLVITVLVNNAGFGTYGEFASTDTMREMDMVDVDCTSLTGFTGYALPYMTKGSRLINTASLASFIPLGNFAVYGACKAYVLSLTVALAAELKSKGIKVTALCPGPVSTEFANVASNGARKEVRHGISPDKTVEHCIKASRKGKLYSMYAFKWKFRAMATRFVSRYLGAWFTYKFNKRPSNPLTPQNQAEAPKVD